MNRERRILEFKNQIDTLRIALEAFADDEQIVLDNIPITDESGAKANRIAKVIDHANYSAELLYTAAQILEQAII